MKINGLIPVFCILLLACLWVTGFFAKSFNDIFIAVSKTSSQGTIAEDTADDLLLTYEAASAAKVSVSELKHTVRLIGTNRHYPSVTGAAILSGSFFTEGMEESKSKTAVLNTKAAFDIFGSIDISGNEFLIDMDKYTIIGVLNDNNDDEATVYLLSAQAAGEAFAVPIINAAESYIKNSFDANGITSAAYDYINVGKLSQLIVEKTFIALKLAWCIILFLLLQKNKHKLKAVTQNILTALWIGFDIFIAQNIMYDCLVWADAPSLSAIGTESFYVVMSRLQTLWSWSNIFFILFISLLIIWVYCVTVPLRKQ